MIKKAVFGVDKDGKIKQRLRFDANQLVSNLSLHIFSFLLRSFKSQTFKHAFSAFGNHLRVDRRPRGTVVSTRSFLMYAVGHMNFYSVLGCNEY